MPLWWGAVCQSVTCQFDICTFLGWHGSTKMRSTIFQMIGNNTFLIDDDDEALNESLM